MCYSTRCVEALVLAPVYCVCSWLDFGIPILLPLQCHDSYWATYWEKKHEEMDAYGSHKPLCKARWKKGEPHVVGPKPPEPSECTFNRRSTGLGGY